MKDNQIGGLPVVEGQKKKIVGNVSVSDIRYVFLKHELLLNFRYFRITVTYLGEIWIISQVGLES